MINRLPNISPQDKVCIICEGNEEYKYLERLIALNVWNEKYKISLVDAEGNGNIPARYQDKYQNDSFDVVLVFCDTEKKPHEQYEDIKHKIDEFHGISNASDEIIIYGSPCTMQIVSKHWTDEMIIKPSKSANAPMIENCTGVKNYKARTDQLTELMEHITVENYQIMKNRIDKIEDDDTQNETSNFSKLIHYLESDNDDWIDKINRKLEGM